MDALISHEAMGAEVSKKFWEKKTMENSLGTTGIHEVIFFWLN